MTTLTSQDPFATRSRSSIPVRVRLLLLATALLATSCYGSTQPTVKVGLIAPFEELYRPDGYEVLNSVKIAIAERNAEGGVAGHQVVLVALNDNARPLESVLQAAKLGIDAHVMGVVGPFQLEPARAIGTELARQDMPWIAPLPMEDSDAPTGFFLSGAPAAFGQAAVRLLAEQGAEGSIVVFSDQAGSRAAALAEGQILGISVDALEPAGADPMDLQGAGGWAWMGDAAAGASLVGRLNGDAVALPLVGGPELGSSVFADRSGRTAPWLSSGAPLDRLPESFVTAYREMAGSDPSPQAVLAYDATNLLLDALDAAGAGDGKLSRASVRDALLQLGHDGWQGLSGSVNWEPGGCESGCWYWRDGPRWQHGVWPSASEGS